MVANLAVISSGLYQRLFPSVTIYKLPLQLLNVMVTMSPNLNRLKHWIKNHFYYCISGNCTVSHCEWGGEVP